jgi:uncharacterized protein (DUF427 family)
MALQMSALLMQGMEQLRYEPTAKRIRASIDGETAVDSTRALLIWEPRRVVPSYAVPIDDVLAELVPADGAGEAMARPVLLGDGPPVLDPSSGFDVHTADGERLTLRAAAGERVGAGFRLADPELAGHVVLDFDAFDHWTEEDEPIIGHPHDPYSRIDVRRSARRVRVEVDGVVLADTNQALALFETQLPTRFYIPRSDVRVDLLPSPTTSVCAYKGQASYWSAEVGGSQVEDVAWSYEQPLDELSVVAGLVCFFNERTDSILDGQRMERPRTPWSPSAP